MQDSSNYWAWGSNQTLNQQVGNQSIGPMNGAFGPNTEIGPTYTYTPGDTDANGWMIPRRKVTGHDVERLEREVEELRGRLAALEARNA